MLIPKNEKQAFGPDNFTYTSLQADDYFIVTDIRNKEVSFKRRNLDKCLDLFFEEYDTFGTEFLGPNFERQLKLSTNWSDKINFVTSMISATNLIVKEISHSECPFLPNRNEGERYFILCKRT